MGSSACFKLAEILYSDPMKTSCPHKETLPGSLGYFSSDFNHADLNRNVGGTLLYMLYYGSSVPARRMENDGQILRISL